MRLLQNIDPDEVSPVRRGANRKRFLFFKDADGEGGMELDTELADVLSIPAEHEGGLLDAIRKAGGDEAEQRAAIAIARLAEGFPEVADAVLKAAKKPTADDDDANEGNESSDDADSVGMSKMGTPAGGEFDLHPDGQLEGHGSGAKNKDGSASGAARDGSDTSEEDLDGDGDGDPLNKRTFSADERRAAASSGAALPDGSFPIQNRSDLANAIQAIGRAKDRGKAMAHIKARAKALGATSMLPDSWGSGTVNKEEHDMSEGTVPVRKEDGSLDLSSLAPDAREFWEEEVRKADELKERVEKAEAMARKAEDELRTKEYILKAEGLSHVAPAQDLAPILKEAAEKMDAESFEKLGEILAAAEEKVSKGGLFTEFGSAARGEGSGGDAWEKIEKMAGELVEKSTDLSHAQAVTKVLDTEQGKALYSEYLADAIGVVS